MALETPTTAEINAQILAQMQATLNQNIPLLPKAFIRVLSKTLAAVYILLYKYANWMFLQFFVARASNEATEVFGRSIRPLTEWGRLIGAGELQAATAAEVRVTLTVEAQGGTLRAGSQITDPASGSVYVLETGVLLNAATVSADFIAAEPGEAANVQVGAQLQFASPLADVARMVTVTELLATGADAESVDSYRRRIIDRFQRRPQGGAYADYDQWGREAAGIANIYPYTSPLPGRVDVYVESATEPDGIPTQAQLDAVAASIELDEQGLASRRPANALVNVYPIKLAEFAVNVTGLDVADPVTVQASIADAVEAFFQSREPFIVGLSAPPRTDRITASALGGIIDRIVSDANGIFSGVSLSLGGGGISLYILGTGEKAKLSALSFS